MATDWEVVDEDLGLSFFEYFDDMVFGGVGVVVDVKGFAHMGCHSVEDGSW